MPNIIDRQLELELATPGVVSKTIASENIVAESMVIERSICDGNFKLGGCIATSFEIQLIDVPPDTVQGKRITVRAYETYSTGNVVCPNINLCPSNNLYPSKQTTEKKVRYFFVGTVDTAERQKNRQIIKIIAYDNLYTLGSNNVYSWFQSFAYYASNAKIPDLLSGLFSAATRLANLPYRVRYKDNGNHNVSLHLNSKLVESNYKGKLQASELLRAVCELTNCWGYVNEEGKFDVLDVKENSTTVNVQVYEDLEFEEYVTQTFDGTIFTYGDSQRKIYGRASLFERPSCYYCDDNAITNCCNDSETMTTIIKNIADTGKLLSSSYCYRPFTLVLDDNDSAGINLGTKIKIATGFGASDVQYVESFVFADKITGIINLKHEFKATGDQILTGNDQEEEVTQQ